MPGAFGSKARSNLTLKLFKASFSTCLHKNAAMAAVECRVRVHLMKKAANGPTLGPLAHV